MRRKLLVASGFCKLATVGTPFLLCCLVGCGGAPPPKPPEDPYGVRVQNCIDAPRPLSDAAHSRMVRIPAGMAVLGSTPQERAQARSDHGAADGSMFENESKVRRARVKSFAIDVTPVTNEAYAEFVAACGAIPPDLETLAADRWAEIQRKYDVRLDYGQVQRFMWNGRTPPSERAKHPAVLVTQDDAAFYCAWRGGRLPTEIEWERAARGPTGNIYPWGSRYDAFRVNTATRGAGDTVDVGSLPHGNPPEGLSDMGGHVFEWTSTRHTGKGKGKRFIVKGNSWAGRGGYGRGAARVARPAKLKNVTLGFRCASYR